MRDEFEIFSSEGLIDYEAFFAGLAEGGFDGLANYEICSPIRGGGGIENLDRSARTYLEWMREHVPQARFAAKSG